MKCAIISDVHDNLVNLDKFLKYIAQQKINIILCCGDLGSQDTYDYLKSKFSGELHIVSGNMDRDFQVELPEIIEIAIDNKKIVLTHKPDSAKKLAETGKFDLVFYGHTHRPWIEKSKLVNPGNLAGIFYQPTFAIYDTKNNNLELKMLNEI